MLYPLKMSFVSIKVHEKGQGLIEYAVIILLVSIIVILVLTTLGTQITAVFDQFTSTLNDL
ncbi:MAG: Flp family type IVb pilin [Anaerolineaceae bacterium]|nr:Flp family type IVb pilin [Anaerolineaceae bacterium]